MVKFFVLLCLIAVAFAQTCTPNKEGTCDDCTTNAVLCAGSKEVSPTPTGCVKAQGTVPTDSPCKFTIGSGYCGLADTATNVEGYTKAAYDAYVNFTKDSDAACKADTNRNSACACEALCSTAECWCPSSCSGSGTTQGGKITFSQALNGTKFCYDYCTNCKYQARSTTFCDANCGGSSTFACKTETKCCEYYSNSASSIFSWIAYFF